MIQYRPRNNQQLQFLMYITGKTSFSSIILEHRFGQKAHVGPSFKAFTPDTIKN
jgi:hypothetical protein